MQVARMSIAEFKSKSEMQRFIDHQNEAFWDVFPTARSAALIKTGPTSLINTTIYPDEAAANSSIEGRSKFLNQHRNGIADTFYYEGEVVFSTASKLTPRVNKKLKSKKVKNKVILKILLDQKKEIADLKSKLNELLAKN